MQDEKGFLTARVRKLLGARRWLLFGFALGVVVVATVWQFVRDTPAQRPVVQADATVRSTTDPTLEASPIAASGFRDGEQFRDCDEGCPAMVVIPAGSFSRGSPLSEADRKDATCRSNSALRRGEIRDNTGSVGCIRRRYRPRAWANWRFNILYVARPWFQSG